MAVAAKWTGLAISETWSPGIFGAKKSLIEQQFYRHQHLAEERSLDRFKHPIRLLNCSLQLCWEKTHFSMLNLEAEGIQQQQQQKKKKKILRVLWAKSRNLRLESECTVGTVSIEWNKEWKRRSQARLGIDEAACIEKKKEFPSLLYQSLLHVSIYRFLTLRLFFFYLK